MGFLGRLFGGKKTSTPSSASSSSSSQPKPTNKKSKANKNNKKLWRFIRSLNLTNNNTRLALPYHPHNNNNNNQPHNAVPLPLNLPLPPGGHIDNSSNSNSNMDPNKHAIAVAVATAAVAEAALVAAQAAAEVVRLTSAGGGGGGGSHALLLRKESAAVKIQSAFRAYLARRALRALRALVKLQALARGFLVRKQMADMLKRMQTLVQVQARARASRSGSSSSSSLHSTSKSSSHRPHMQRYNSHANPGGLFDTDKTRLGSNLLDLYMDESMWNRQRDIPGRNIHDDEKSAKVLEVDTWKPHSFSPQKNRNFKTKNHAFTSDNIGESFRAFDSPSKRSMNIWNLSKEYPRVKDDLSRYAENIPQFAPVSSRPGSSSCRREQPFSPTRSDASWGYFSGYSGHPNYMTNTESSRAKVRSQSAPKQRIEFDRTGSAKRSLQGSWDYSEMENGFSLHSDYWNKTYLGASHLNRHGRPELR